MMLPAPVRASGPIEAPEAAALRVATAPDAVEAVVPPLPCGPAAADVADPDPEWWAPGVPAAPDDRRLVEFAAAGDEGFAPVVVVDDEVAVPAAGFSWSVVIEYG